MRMIQTPFPMYRTIVYVCAILLMTLCVISCTKSDPDPALDTRLQCDWPKASSIVETITDEPGWLIKRPTKGDYLLVVKNKSYIPCNVTAQVDSVAIIVSGYEVLNPLSPPPPANGPILNPGPFLFEITNLTIK